MIAARAVAEGITPLEVLLRTMHSAWAKASANGETVTSFQDALVAAQLEVRAPDQGMHLVAYLNNAVSDTGIEDAAKCAGVVVRAVSRFYRAAPARSGLMLGFSGFPPSVIVPAAAHLAKVVTAARAVI